MIFPDRLPFRYPTEEEIQQNAIRFIELAETESYTPEEAKEDAFVFLNMRNAVTFRFIESLDHVGPKGRMTFTMNQDND